MTALSIMTLSIMAKSIKNTENEITTLGINTPSIMAFSTMTFKIRNAYCD